MKALMDTLRRLPETFFLVLNAGMGAFVLLAHGGALLLVMSGRIPTPPGYEDMVRTMVPVTLPLALLVVLASLVGLVKKTVRPSVLSLQALVLFLAGLATLVWAIGILVNGIPAGNFMWTPGFLTCWLAYSTLLLSRFALRTWQESPVVRYAPLFVTAVALPVDGGVFLRLLTTVIRPR